MIMKKHLLLFVAALLPVIAVTTLTSCSKEKNVVDPDEEIADNVLKVTEVVVTVDANGNADGGHRFQKIGENDFYIDDIKYTVQNGNLNVSGYNNTAFAGTARIISTLKYGGKTMNVVGIGKEAFSLCTKLTAVSIPKGVKNIGNSAFSYCRKLALVAIGESVTSIGSEAFGSCSALTNFYCYAENVPTTDSSAFNNAPTTSSILHAPEGSVNYYRSASPWNSFGKVVAIK